MEYVAFGKGYYVTALAELLILPLTRRSSLLQSPFRHFPVHYLATDLPLCITLSATVSFLETRGAVGEILAPARVLAIADRDYVS